MKALDYILKNSPIFREMQPFVLVSECDVGDLCFIWGKEKHRRKACVI